MSLKQSTLEFAGARNGLISLNGYVLWAEQEREEENNLLMVYNLSGKYLNHYLPSCLNITCTQGEWQIP